MLLETMKSEKESFKKEPWDSVFRGVSEYTINLVQNLIEHPFLNNSIISIDEMARPQGSEMERIVEILGVYADKYWFLCIGKNAIKSQKEFKELMKDPNHHMGIDMGSSFNALLRDGESEIMRFLWGKFGKKEFLKERDNKLLIDFLTNVREENVKIMFEQHKITTIRQLCELYQNGDLESVESIFNRNKKQLDGFFRFEKKESVERKRNAQIVNENQKKISQIPLDIENMNKRTLVLYLHDEKGLNCIDRIDFLIMAKTLNWWIENNYSRVFTNIKLVTREEENAPKRLEEICPCIENGEYVSGDEFKEECSVGSNVVHFTHGTPQSKKFGSIPILCQSIRIDKQKMNGLTDSDFVSLPLFFDKKNTEFYLPIRHQQKMKKNEEALSLAAIKNLPEEEMLDDNHSHQKIMKEILNSVIILEEKMIKKAKKSLIET